MLQLLQFYCIHNTSFYIVLISIHTHISNLIRKGLISIYYQILFFQSPPKPIKHGVMLQHSIGQFTLIIGGFTFIIYSDLATDQIWNSFQDLLPASDIFTNLVSFSNNSFIDVPKFTYNGIKIVVLEDLKGNLFSYSNNIDIINVIGRKTYYYHNL